jgi:hypothetical protein
MQMNILIILLGCHIASILNDRIHTALSFARFIQNNNHTNIDWFLSGGIKDKDKNSSSEADMMRETLDANYNYGNKFNYILDTLSTNTAENFMIANQYINNYNAVYVVTSDFHYERAKCFADLIIPNNEFNWVLSSFEEIDSKYWERIHMKNINNDIKQSMDKFKYI